MGAYYTSVTVCVLFHVQKWVWAYRDKNFHVKVNTNNGLERQNGTLKHEYLAAFRDSSLTGLADVIINKYLPDAWKKYCIVVLSTCTRATKRFHIMMQLIRLVRQNTADTDITVLANNRIMCESKR